MIQLSKEYMWTNQGCYKFLEHKLLESLFLLDSKNLQDILCMGLLQLSCIRLPHKKLEILSLQHNNTQQYMYYKHLTRSY